MITRDQALGWYPQAYRDGSYRMGRERKQLAARVLYGLPRRGTLFDVGAGRGEMIETASMLGFYPVYGCETVPELCTGRVTYGLAHALPAANDSYDVVTMFDVMEHLVENDCHAALRQLRRVARRHVVLSISNLRSIVNGIDVHITKKSYDDWDAIIRAQIPGTVTRYRNQCRISETWRIDLPA